MTSPASCKQAPGAFVPVIDRNRCEGKADCVRVCPVGVFAVDFIPAGTPIWALDERFDKVFTEEEVAGFPKNIQDYFTRYGYPHMERDGFVVLELDNGRFMNHSTEPNTDFTRPDVGYAIADIHPGEELI